MQVDRILFYLIILLAPTQLTKFFFFDSLLVSGLRVDYHAFSISITQIVIILLFISYIKKRGFKKLVASITRPIFILFIISISLSTVLSLHPLASFIRLLVLVELLFLGFYIVHEKPSFTITINLFLLTIFLSSLLGISQFYMQHSLGGLFYFFGERTFSVSTPGIARSSMYGITILRPYATFPHPNVLAAFISLILPFSYYRLIGAQTINKSIMYLTMYIILISTLILTQSRVTIVTGSIVLLLTFTVFFKKYKWVKIKVALLTLFLPFILLFPFVWNRFTSVISSSDTSLTKRIELTKVALNAVLTNPYVGVGANNFIFHIPNTVKNMDTSPLLQPVHNTYLLILSELGLVGLFLFLYLLYWSYKAINVKRNPLRILLLITLGQIIVLLVFDHYFYTLFQSQLLFTIFIAFMIKKETDEKNYSSI